MKEGLIALSYECPKWNVMNKWDYMSKRVVLDGYGDVEKKVWMPMMLAEVWERTHGFPIINYIRMIFCN